MTRGGGCAPGVFAAALAAAALPGCTCDGSAAPSDAATRATASRPADAAARPERVVITQVATRVVDPEAPREVYPRLLAQKLGRTLTESPWFFAKPADVPDTYRPREAAVDLVITYDVVGEGGEAKVVAAVTAELAFASSEGELAVRDNVLAERPVEGETANLDGLVAVHVERAVAQVGAGLIDKEAVRSGPPERVLEALDSGDPALASWALEVAGARRLAEARPRAEALLGSDTEAVRGAAIGTLVALGDPRSVPALADLAEFQDTGRMRTLIEAISALGGDEAREFLEFVATGHPDAAIKRRAEEGLERLDDASRR